MCHALVPATCRQRVDQCMSNTTYPSPEHSYETVARSATNALNNVPGSDKLQNVETATDLASEAWDAAAQGMRFGDHQCMPNYIRHLKNCQPGMVFVKVDKNPGTSWLICEVLWATQLLQHFLASPQHNIILQCDTIEQAKWELLTMIDEAKRRNTCPLFAQYPTLA